MHLCILMNKVFKHASVFFIKLFLFKCQEWQEERTPAAFVYGKKNLFSLFHDEASWVSARDGLSFREKLEFKMFATCRASWYYWVHEYQIEDVYVPILTSRQTTRIRRLITKCSNGICFTLFLLENLHLKKGFCK